MVLDYCLKYCTYHPFSSYIFPKCRYCEGMLKLSIAADMIYLTVQEDISILGSSCWDVKCHSQLNQVFATSCISQGELKARWLVFEFLRWLSRVPVQAHLQLPLHDAGGHPWSTRAPTSDLWAWLVCWCCPWVWQPGASLLSPARGRLCSSRLLSTGLSKRGAGMRMGRIGLAAAPWVWRAGSQSCHCFTGTLCL